MEKAVLDVVLNSQKFPRMLSKKEGISLKKYFELDTDFGGGYKGSGDLEFRYYYSKGEDRYVLIEEYLFKENELILDISRAIGVNYYLNKLS